MTGEWGEFQNQGFCLGSKISLHFPSFGHSIIILEWRNEVELSRISLKWYLSIVIFISFHSRHFEMMKEWRNEEECSVFLGEEKTGFWDTSHSTIIRSFQCHSNLYTRPSFDHWWIWNWPSNWNGISMRNDAQMTGMTSEWFNMVLSLLKRQQHIKSFRSHSFHSRLILKRMSSSEIKWGMMLKWQECPLNDLIWCCLF